MTVMDLRTRIVHTSCAAYTGCGRFMRRVAEWKPVKTFVTCLWCVCDDLPRLKFMAQASHEQEVTMQPKNNAPSRSVQEIGPGDYVKIGSHWEKVTGNTAQGAEHTPRSWTVTTEGGREHGMYGINRYAKAEDIE